MADQASSFTVDPYSIEVRYTLDLMVQILHTQSPESVRIYSDSAELVKALVRRMDYGQYSIYVDSHLIQEDIQASLDYDLEVAGARPCALALLPFWPSPGHTPAERRVIASMFNSLSYRILLHPLKVGITGTAPGRIRRMRAHFHIDRVAGLYSVRWFLFMARALLVQSWSTSQYLTLSFRAMQYLYEFNWMWRFSRVVVFSGQKKDG